MSRADEMEGLRNDISALREARFTLIHDLRSFAGGMRKNVAEMVGGFRSAHAEMADRTRGERAAFVSTLRATVAGLRKQFADENLAVRLAWLGRRVQPGSGGRARRK